MSTGNWIAGPVGSGKILAVGTWKARESVPTRERLNLVTPSGLRTIVTGPAAVVAASATANHIAVLRSNQAWPPAGDVGPATPAPTVGVYSAEGAVLGEVTVNIPSPDACGYSDTTVKVALAGDKLAVLTQTILQPGSLQSTVEVYDWKTGTLEHTWPVSLGHTPGAGLAASGQLAAVQRPSELLLLDLSTGKTASIAPASISTIAPRGLVYAVNSGGRHPYGKLVFVPTAKLSALLG